MVLPAMPKPGDLLCVPLCSRLPQPCRVVSTFSTSVPACARHTSITCAVTYMRSVLLSTGSVSTVSVVWCLVSCATVFTTSA